MNLVLAAPSHSTFLGAGLEDAPRGVGWAQGAEGRARGRGMIDGSGAIEPCAKAIVPCFEHAVAELNLIQMSLQQIYFEISKYRICYIMH